MAEEQITDKGYFCVEDLISKLPKFDVTSFLLLQLKAINSLSGPSESRKLKRHIAAFLMGHGSFWAVQLVGGITWRTWFYGSVDDGVIFGCHRDFRLDVTLPQLVRVTACVTFFATVMRAPWMLFTIQGNLVSP